MLIVSAVGTQEHPCLRLPPQLRARLAPSADAVGQRGGGFPNRRGELQQLN